MTLLLLALQLCFCDARLFAAEPAQPGMGDKFESIQVGKTAIHDAVVVSISIRSVTFRHAEGLTSVPLRELPPDLQARFGYNPAAAAALEKTLEQNRRRTQQRQQAAHQAYLRLRRSGGLSVFDVVLQQFGHRPTLLPEVDFRPKFAELDLKIKDQGRRQSCSVFAVLSALEFENAVFRGRKERLSEDYLIWATRRTMEPSSFAATPEEERVSALYQAENDAGFSLEEVVNGLRAYGVPSESSVPNTFNRSMADIVDPPPEAIEDARSRSQVFIHSVPGRDQTTRILNSISALNLEIPVVIGIRWPAFQALKSGLLSDQYPLAGYSHAVTLVGYRNPTGNIEDVIFCFRNSWGSSWGEEGYGYVTFRYLHANLLDAVLIENQR